ncbi:MAG: response regulator [Stenotrophomonas sp.]|uniref:Hpt domain-containing response regulator n=1 Tax=Stenotrophomonas sp. UBA7606 TaxID=1947559 RepID=UPI0025F08287|nr:hybrid sensor histidine kinase/response regulator [Stenotrophomonas sp. UBA7606]
MNTQSIGATPRLLLVEDDMTSQGFFQLVLESLPATVDIADSHASALRLTNGVRHDLWLIDVNLPDGDGPSLLQKLRAQHPSTPALAHTAEVTVEVEQALQQAGFNATMAKPISRDTLLRTVRRSLAQAVPGDDPGNPEPAPDWDESAALNALNGQQAHVRALRELFLSELPGARDAVSQALVRHDDTALRAQLHKLQASCGFVGASRLARAVRQLHHDPASQQAQQQFGSAVSALLR